MLYKEITLAFGLCAVDKHVYEMAYSAHLISDAVKPFGIKVGVKGGAWKPRTRLRTNNGEKIFEGLKEEGLRMLAEAVDRYDLFAVSECMSEMDARHFPHYLTPERDYIQIGARTSQAYALLYEVAGRGFNILLKNPLQGVDIEEAVGSLERFEKLRGRRELVYCLRGQKKQIDPDGVRSPDSEAYYKEVNSRPTQHPDSRFWNNIEWVNILRADPRLEGVKFAYDPSHTWGGKNDVIRRKIGETAILAMTDEKYLFDFLLLDAHDKSSFATVDANQALLTTTNGVDWIPTNAGQVGEIKPNEGKEPKPLPLTVVDISLALVKHQAKEMGIGPDDEKVLSAIRQLHAIRWGMTAVSVK